MINIERVLVLSPHPDDGELGAGGTIARFIEEGKEVYYVAFSCCQDSLADNLPPDTLKIECNKSTNILGIPAKNIIVLDYRVRTFPSHRQEILEQLVEFNKYIKPDLVLAPSSNDIHQDHQTIYAETLRAFKKSASIWGYEHPWNNLGFTTDVFINLHEKHLLTKIKALKQYKSQDSRPYFDEQYIRSLAYTRGLQVNHTYAETFELSRMIVE